MFGNIPSLRFGRAFIVTTGTNGGKNPPRKPSKPLRSRSQSNGTRRATCRDKVLTEAISRDVIGGILERTTGETLRQSTVREFCDEWLRGKAHTRQERTAERYQTSIDRFKELLGNKADRPIAAVTPRDCQKFYDTLAEK